MTSVNIRKEIKKSHSYTKNKGGDYPLLEVKDLSITFRQYQSGLRESYSEVIKKFDITIHKGEIVAIVGSSGSGKSLLADAILGILPENAELSGFINFEGEELTKENQIRLRGEEIFLIPQAINSLDPLMKAAKQVQTVIKSKDKKSIQQRIFQRLGLPVEAGNRYPNELSGGMARRVLVSTAMVSDAKLVIADEPTPGMDESSREETISYLKKMAMEGKGIMFITHDIGAALQIADKIGVFYAGYTVEIANIEAFVGNGEGLRHPYTKSLWNALPENGFIPLKGSQPLPGEITSGCVFSSRCPLATELCIQKQPEAMKLDGGMVRCLYA